MSKMVNLMDNRDIRTRVHDGKLFMIPRTQHYKFNLNPFLRAQTEWNKLEIDLRNSVYKRQFTVLLINSIPTPLIKVL